MAKAHFLKAISLIQKGVRGDVAPALAAQEELKKAIVLDPKFARAHAALAWAGYLVLAHGNQQDRSWLKQQVDAARESLKIKQTGIAYVVMSKWHFRPENYWPGNEHDAAITLLEQALEVEPGNPDIMVEMAHTLAFAGQLERASQLMKKAMRLNAVMPIAYRRASGIIEYLRGDYKSAIINLKIWRDSEPTRITPSASPGSMWLAAAQAMSGQKFMAQQTLVPMLTGLVGQYEELSARGFLNRSAFKNEREYVLLIKGLLAAGLGDPWN